MSTQTVGDLRKAIEGLPDDAPIVLAVLHGHINPAEVYVELVRIVATGDGHLAIMLHVEGCDEDDLDELEDDGDE